MTFKYSFDLYANATPNSIPYKLHFDHAFIASLLTTDHCWEGLSVTKWLEERIPMFRAKQCFKFVLIKTVMPESPLPRGWEDLHSIETILAVT